MGAGDKSERVFHLCALYFELCALYFELWFLVLDLCALNLVPFDFGLWTFDFGITCHLSLVTYHSSYCFRIIFPAARTTSERGTMRSVSTIKKFVQPDIT